MTDKLTIDDFAKAMQHTNQVMARNLATSMFDDSALSRFLGPGRKVPWHERVKLRVGEGFLWAATKLGAYNDYD